MTACLTGRWLDWLALDCRRRSCRPLCGWCLWRSIRGRARLLPCQGCRLCLQPCTGVLGWGLGSCCGHVTMSSQGLDAESWCRRRCRGTAAAEACTRQTQVAGALQILQKQGVRHQAGEQDGGWGLRCTILTFQLQCPVHEQDCCSRWCVPGAMASGSSCSGAEGTFPVAPLPACGSAESRLLVVSGMAGLGASSAAGHALHVCWQKQPATIHRDRHLPKVACMSGMWLIRKGRAMKLLGQPSVECATPCTPSSTKMEAASIHLGRECGTALCAAACLVKRCMQPPCRAAFF